MTNTVPHSGRVALVTGGSRGIGAAVVRRLAREGADVAFSYLKSEQKANELAADVSAQEGVRVEAIRADAGSAKEMTRLVEDTVERLGRIDILVSNAGTNLFGLIGDSDRDEQAMARQFNTNLHGVVAATKAAAPHLRDGGRIVLVSALGATRSFGQPIGDYAASKAGLEAYGRAWAHEFGPRGITVNSVQPGVINTDMMAAVKDIAAVLEQTIPVGRVGLPEDIAGVVAFLTGPDGAYVNGTTIVVDGGMSA